MAIEYIEGFGDPEERDDEEEYLVTSPNGVELELRSEKEIGIYEKMRDEILANYTFTDPSDLADLDRILLLELTLYRTNNALSTNMSELGFPLTTADQRRLHQSVRELSDRLLKEKDALGLSKSARDKDSAETVAGYLDNLRKRAGEFGVHRNKQAQMAIALMQEVHSISDTWLRGNELERSKLGMQDAEDVLRWITSEMYPKLNELDLEFIKEHQRYWVEDI